MKKYGIKVRVMDGEYRWMLDHSEVLTDVGPMLFETKQEAIDFAEKMQWTLYEVDLYPFKEF
jgi:hypothetical protein